MGFGSDCAISQKSSCESALKSENFRDENFCDVRDTKKKGFVDRYDEGIDDTSVSFLGLVCTTHYMH